MYNRVLALAEIEKYRKKYLQFSRFIKADTELYQFILSEVQKTHPKCNDRLSAKIYLFENPATELICPYGNQLHYNSKCKKYTCRLSCQCTIIKRYHTNLQKYGFSTPSKSPKIKEKTKNTCLERYGVVNTASVPEFQEKQKQTVRERYGVEHFAHSLEIREKTKKTLQEKYGKSNLFSVDSIRQKCKQTMIERYGSEYASSVPDINARQVQTRKNNTLKRLGVTHESKLHISPQNREILDNREKFAELLSLMGRKELAKFLGVGTNLISTRHKKFGLDIMSINKSCYEIEIKNWLSSMNVSFITNSRTIIKPKELDFFLPEYKIGIEFNGDYWHANPSIYTANDFILAANIGKVPASYIWARDAEKQKLCIENNVDLIVIWESVWNSKKQMIKDSISDKLSQKYE